MTVQLVAHVQLYQLGTNCLLPEYYEYDLKMQGMFQSNTDKHKFADELRETAGADWLPLLTPLEYMVLVQAAKCKICFMLSICLVHMSNITGKPTHWTTATHGMRESEKLRESIEVHCEVSCMSTHDTFLSQQLL